MTTLQEAVSNGKGTERQFNCHIHDDRNASASVNVIKGKWVCYACGASGDIDVDIDPQDLRKQVHDLLNAPEIVPYPESWLVLYSGPCEYWEKRFSAEAIQNFNLGFDPSLEMPCYPLRTPSGVIHGLVYRNNDYQSKRKYKYPWGVQIQNYLFNYSFGAVSTVVLVEGAADAIALWEVGITAFAIYGTRPSSRQMDLVRKLDPKRVVCAYDQDRAGREAAVKTRRLFKDSAELVIACWDADDGKDPDELTPSQRNDYIGSLIV